MVSVRSWGPWRFQFILNAIKAHFSSLCVAFHHTHGVLMRWMFCQQTEEYLQMCFVCWSIAMKGCWCCSVFFFFSCLSDFVALEQSAFGIVLLCYYVSNLFTIDMSCYCFRKGNDWIDRISSNLEDFWGTPHLQWVRQIGGSGQ